MCSKLLQSVSAQYDKHLPFVVYRKPKGAIVKAILQKDSQVHYVKDFSETGFVFAPFDSNQQSVLLRMDSVLKANYIPKKKTVIKTEISFGDAIAKKEFHIKFYDILNRFAHKQIKNLITSMPPQHGKSEGATRRLLSFIAVDFTTRLAPSIFSVA